MASDAKAPEALEWQEGEAAEGGDELCQATAPSVKTAVTHLSQTHSADRTPRSPVGMGFLAKYGPPRKGGRRTPELPSESLMAIQIRRLDQILGSFDPKVTVSQDRQNPAFSSLPTDILLMAQELLKVTTQLKSGVQLVGRELARTDKQVQLLDLASQKVDESFPT